MCRPRLQESSLLLQSAVPCHPRYRCTGRRSPRSRERPLLESSTKKQCARAGTSPTEHPTDGVGWCCPTQHCPHSFACALNTSVAGNASRRSSFHLLELRGAKRKFVPGSLCRSKADPTGRQMRTFLQHWNRSPGVPLPRLPVFDKESTSCTAHAALHPVPSLVLLYGELPESVQTPDTRGWPYYMQNMMLTARE